LFRNKNTNSYKVITSVPLLIFFLIPLFAIMLENINSITHYALPQTLITRIFSCLAWVMSCFKFHSFLLFIEKNIEKNNNTRWYHYGFYCIEAILSSMIIFDQIYRYLYTHKATCSEYIYATVIIFWIVSIAPSCLIIIKKLLDRSLPILIQKQFITFLCFFLIPHLLSILIEFTPFLLTGQPQIIAFTNISLILMTASIYFCFKKIMQFRFLNLSDHVQIKPNFQNVINFKQTIEQINVATTPSELGYISKEFCSEQFNIEKRNIHLYIHDGKQPIDKINEQIEHFLNASLRHQKSIDILIKHKILVAHEIEFDEFYTQDPVIILVANFLRTLKADIFVPIIHNQHISGAIIIHQHPEKILYNNHTQNQLIVFAQFLAPALYNMQHQNILTLLQESKEIKETLHEKHQEIAQYKESIKQLLKDRIEHHIGIIFCKNKQFHVKNQEAEKLLTFNPNVQPNNPTTLTLINFAQKIEKFQTTSSMCLTLSDGQKLMISGMPQTHTQAGVLLVIRKPEATDLIKMHMDALKNSSHRDYLLYLETTKAGQKINQLLPSGHDIFINIKIQLLQAALQKSALFLEMHEQDIDTVIKTITYFDHPRIETLTITEQTSDLEHTIFGTNPLLETQHQPGLLDKLDNGILVIKNIEHLSILTQQKLAYFIRYGIFTPIKSEQRKFCNTRIICTTSQNLLQLYQDGIIISDLHVALKKHYIQIPSLITMPEDQLYQLIDGFMYQNMQNDIEKALRTLTAQDKQAIIDKRIASIFTLQQKVYNLMTSKSEHATALNEHKNKTNIQIYDTNPEMTRAAQLGKHALKDIQLMKSLWKQLGNQTKIADLLGVNRSSVNRRCKEYNLV
ncbi:sigma 54-interacting transcriptional regulator, partial [Candidatus Babeliales bacterium]|nr:sigma 54-interacting transcriptional regulator [Candidatus Babeliales bacterium]